MKKEQEVEFGTYFRYLRDDSLAPVSSEETVTSVSYYFEHDNLVNKSYSPRHLRYRGTLWDHLVVPRKIICLVLHVCHDHDLPGGCLGFKPIYGTI